MPVRIVFLLFVITGAFPVEPQQKATQPFWTTAEQKEYDQCLPHSTEVWKDRKAGEDYCLVVQERKRWLRLHPQSTSMKEDKAKMQKCLQTSATKINGTRAEFRVAFDRCMDEAYGSPGATTR